MKCQKCGADMPEGDLYCTKCGEEIHIVPYFEPEVETELNENLHRISDEAFGKQRDLHSVKVKKKKHYLRWVILLVVFSMCAGFIALIYLFNSPLYLKNRGNMLMSQGNYKDAVYFYEKALDRGTENKTDVYMYLIGCYEELEYDGKYEEYLLKVLANKEASETQLFTVYTKLIRLYEEGNSYLTINNLLKSCNNDKIIALYQKYMVEPPVFSHLEGVYKEIIPLKLSSMTGNKILYTINGGEPLEDGLIYKEPIFLENGTYEFRAVCINEYGIASDVIVKKYEVNFATK